MIGGYLDERGMRVLAALDDRADARAVSVAAVALAGLSAQPTVLAPVASARTVDQLVYLCRMTNLTLSPPELERLGSAATPTP